MMVYRLNGYQLFKNVFCLTHKKAAGWLLFVTKYSNPVAAASVLTIFGDTRLANVLNKKVPDYLVKQFRFLKMGVMRTAW